MQLMEKSIVLEKYQLVLADLGPSQPRKLTQEMRLYLTLIN